MVFIRNIGGISRPQQSIKANYMMAANEGELGKFYLTQPKSLDPKSKSSSVLAKLQNCYSHVLQEKNRMKWERPSQS